VPGDDSGANNEEELAALVDLDQVARAEVEGARRSRVQRVARPGGPLGRKALDLQKGHDGLLAERAIASVDIAQPIADGAEPVLQVHHGGPVDTWLHVVTLLLEG
jgi:hypothetical protein